MPEMLLVPVRVEGLWLGRDQLVVGSTADFSRLPFDDGLRDINPDVANISEDIVSQPFEDQNLYLKAGVHLHWTLPRGLTMQRPTPRGPEFPAVPDRWLVVRWRRVGARWDVEMSWVVESNYLFPDGQGADSGSIAFPLKVGHPKRPARRPFRYLGRKVPLDAWRAKDLEAEYLDRLTAVGHGEPTFAAFYPNCLSVLGLHDDLTPDRLAGAGYDVFGWYSDGEKNPLAQYFLDFQRAGWKPSKPEATIQDDFARAVAENLGWSVEPCPGPILPGPPALPGPPGLRYSRPGGRGPILLRPRPEDRAGEHRHRGAVGLPGRGNSPRSGGSGRGPARGALARPVPRESPAGSRREARRGPP